MRFTGSRGPNHALLGSGVGQATPSGEMTAGANAVSRKTASGSTCSGNGCHGLMTGPTLSFSTTVQRAPSSMSGTITSGWVLPARHTSRRPVTPRATNARHASNSGFHVTSIRTASRKWTR